MSVPKSVIRMNKNGVQYVSNCDRCQYTIRELTRAALRDVGKFICYRCNQKAGKLFHGSLRKSKRVRGKTSAFQYWARSRESDLQVGVDHDSWYGTKQELGGTVITKYGPKKMPKKAILTDTARENIAEIVKIESQYLSALEDEARALALIDENEYKGGADDD